MVKLLRCTSVCLVLIFRKCVLSGTVMHVYKIALLFKMDSSDKHVVYSVQAS